MGEMNIMGIIMIGALGLVSLTVFDSIQGTFNTEMSGSVMTEVLPLIKSIFPLIMIIMLASVVIHLVLPCLEDFKMPRYRSGSSGTYKKARPIRTPKYVEILDFPTREVKKEKPKVDKRTIFKKDDKSRYF